VIDAHLLHADHCVQSGQIGPALALYRTAAAAAEGQGDLVRALSIHVRIARIDHDPSARFRVGELLGQTGQQSPAGDVFDGIVRDELRLARIPQALAAARAAYAIDPTPPRRAQLAGLLAQNGAIDEAVEHFHACAAAELTANRLPGFHRFARRVVTLRPGHAPTLRLMIDAFLRGRDVHRAVATIRTLRAIQPDDRCALEGMAQAFLVLGNQDRAAEVRRLLAARDGAAAEPSPAAVPVREATRVIDVADLMEVAPRRDLVPPVRRATLSTAPRRRAAMG